MRMHMGIDIEAPPETAWTYLVEPGEAMSWYTMFTVFNWTNDERGPGATFYWEEDVRGKTHWNQRSRRSRTSERPGPTPRTSTHLLPLTARMRGGRMPKSYPTRQRNSGVFRN
jgi:hypothetical protein